MSAADKACVEAFALALDQEDYPLAKSCLAEDCRYESPQGLLVGADRIVASYQGNGDNAVQRFDAIAYRHQVEEASPDISSRTRFTITFFDRVTLGDKSHEYHCQQIATTCDGKIHHIEHVEIDGQRPALDAFIESQGGVE